MNRHVRLLGQQLALEQRAFWRNPQSAFFTFALPVVLVVIFGLIESGNSVPGTPDTTTITLMIPGFLAFGLIIAAYGNLAGTIAVLRADGVLKRIRATPLPPATYLAGHLANVLVVTAAISVTTIGIGMILFDTAPRLETAALLGGSIILGVTCFAALGLSVSAAIPTADAAGPITNGTYVPLAILSGTFSADLQLPSWLDPIVSALPIRAFTDALRAGYSPQTHGSETADLFVLALWAGLGIALALRYFRWNP